MTAEPITTDVGSCARCGKDHTAVTFQPFARPIRKDGDGPVRYTHWAPCPSNGEPILLVVHATTGGNVLGLP